MKLSCLEDGVGCSQNTGLKRPSGIGTGREWGTSEQDVLYDGPEASALREQTLGSETIKKQTLEFDTDTACSSTGLVWGYPMSKCLAELPVSHTRLSYEAREVACHSVETYRERLVGKRGGYSVFTVAQGLVLVKIYSLSSCRQFSSCEGTLPQSSG